MTNPSYTQSQKRFQESIAPLFRPGTSSSKKCLILKSSSDVGVIRNGGRNGARFAPQSFLSTFKKFAANTIVRDYSFEDFEVANPDEERQDFHSAQLKQSERIKKILNEQKDNNARIVHLGGGHDHIYPLLSALGSGYQKIIVINVDAHADTRTDEQFHSGTPFRQFAKDYQGSLLLYQVGLHPFTNTFSTLSPLERGYTEILWKKNLNEENINNLFEKIKTEMDDTTAVIFSLDADALAGHEVPGVSAVNPDGLTKNELLKLWRGYQELTLKHGTILGIYELNPVYDTLAGISMRTTGSFFFETL